MKRAVFVHGWGGFPEEGWRPWLKEQLEAKGWEVVNPEMPNTDSPTEDQWLEKLQAVVGEPDENTFLIGHSLGGITVLRYLESLADDKKVGGSILVAGFANDLTYDGYKGELASFFTKPVDWNLVKGRCNQFFILHSQEDTWVEQTNYYELVESLGARGALQTGFKHYSGDDGITEIPIVLAELERMAQ